MGLGRKHRTCRLPYYCENTALKDLVLEAHTHALRDTQDTARNKKELVQQGK
jgi:DNA-binding protein YbaB